MGDFMPAIACPSEGLDVGMWQGEHERMKQQLAEQTSINNTLEVGIL
jgi:hypothetical protein